MNYIKPPTSGEKSEYWENVKSFAITSIVVILTITILLGFSFLLFTYTNIIITYTLYILVIILIGLLILLAASIFTALYFAVYKYWHMIHKRYRVGYYSSFMNSLVLSICITVAAIVFFYFMYKILPDYNLKITIVIIIMTLLIIFGTIYFITKIRKEKPSLTPLTLQETEDREFIKELCFHILETEDLGYTCVNLYGINYLGVTDCYINYSFYNKEQVEEWKYNLNSEVLTIRDIFREMMEVVHIKDKKLYLNVCEKAQKEIEKLDKEINKTGNKDILKDRLREYLD